MNVALDDYWVIAFCYHSTADENCYWFVNSIFNFLFCVLHFATFSDHLDVSVLLRTL